MASLTESGPSLRNPELCDQLANWFETPLGAALIAAERAAVADASSSLFGVRQLEVGIAPNVSVSASGNCGHRFTSVAVWNKDASDSTVICVPEEMALPNDSIDVVVLHHTLDFVSHPHQALREASRVLRGGGHMVIVGFNPVSLWGWRRMAAKKPVGPWHGRFLSRKRVEDWLGVLDFSLEERQLNFYWPPLQNPGILARFEAWDRFASRRRVPGGAFYLMVAQKRVGARVRQPPIWHRRNVIAMPVANRARHPAHYPKEPS